MPRHRAPSRPRHRAPTRRARPIATVALTGMALGGSVLLPLTAMAEPAHDQLSGADHSREASSSDFTDTDSDDSDPADSSDDGDSGDGSDGSSDHSSDGSSDHGDSGYSDESDRADDSARPGRTVAHHSAAGAVRRTTHTRPMSSGEEQYRNGCRHGYIVEGCSQYDVPHLLKRGINPFL